MPPARRMTHFSRSSHLQSNKITVTRQRSHRWTDEELNLLACAGSGKENVEPSSSRSISGALPDNISEDGPSKETHARVGDSFAHHLEPDTSGPRNILLHREAREGHLEFLLWAPIWQSEDDIAKVHSDQLKRYKERLDVGLASRASQARKRARSPFQEPRRSSRQKKPRQC
ncbi:hypothetical protein I7I51_03949 [Histoplasma capsulatum]|uniref:Uncharacterized protein n=1 Tax=Ajellomyces capsulatus TaxID=5037 RepID=A0A8A1MBA8_AJECA|nr:hypothetical protein I7I51_03949 [Histoplasma capsulatum]